MKQGHLFVDIVNQILWLQMGWETHHPRNDALKRIIHIATLTVSIRFSSGVLLKKFYIFKAICLRKSPLELNVSGSRFSGSSVCWPAAPPPPLDDYFLLSYWLNGSSLSIDALKDSKAFFCRELLFLRARPPSLTGEKSYSSSSSVPPFSSHSFSSGNL